MFEQMYTICRLENLEEVATVEVVMVEERAEGVMVVVVMVSNPCHSDDAEETTEVETEAASLLPTTCVPTTTTPSFATS